MSALFRIFAVTALSAFCIAGCSRPNFAQSDKATISSQATPKLPGWAMRFEGKKLASIGSRTSRCIGFIDNVVLRYSGDKPGVEIVGWGWDSSRKQPIAKALIADANEVVVGAASGGLSRPDVPAAIKSISSETTGWRGIAYATSGIVYAWGFASKNSVCPLGKLEL